jgi:hypothetical protein
MQDLSHSYILLNGEPKALQIESISMENHKVYHVRFKNNSRCYRYNADNVVWIKDGSSLCSDLHNVYVEGVKQVNVSEIMRFEHLGDVYWRLVFKKNIYKRLSWSSSTGG